jgi:hypothetical protein
MKTLVTTIALTMLSLSAFSQQRETVQPQRAEASQTSYSPPQSYQPYVGPQREVVPAQSSQQAAAQYTPPSNPQTNGIIIASDRNNSGKNNSAEEHSEKNKRDQRTHADMTKPLVEPIGTATCATIVNCADNQLQLVYICPFCGRLYYSGGYCSYDNTELVPQYVDSRGISR